MVEKEVPFMASTPVIASSPDGSDGYGRVFEIVFREPEPIGFNLSEHFLTYVLKNAICTRCLEIIGDTTHLRTCDNPARGEASWSRSRTGWCFMPSAEEAEFRRRWNRERTRFRENDRKYRLRRIPEPSQELLAELRNQQGNRCYYCLVEFDGTPHLDHFKSVATGGSNSIFNLVYACERCNKEKGTENGDLFLNRWFAAQLVPAELSREIKEMRNSVARWKKQFSPRNLAKVERLVSEHALRIPDQNSIEFDEWCREELTLFKLLEQIKNEKGQSSK